jgi:hypothetical protein
MTMSETTTYLAGVVAALHDAAALAAALDPGAGDRLDVMDLTLGIELAHAEALAIAVAAAPLEDLPETTGTTVVSLLCEAEHGTRQVPVERHPGLSQLVVRLIDLTREAERLEQH